ncbi:PaaI family thioesterase [Brevundimonas sp. GCM10030266]|uniref:PaaI family thioesterase n=1 Tax=Brevundimonas sp. GCM10030266 TaxID=3273386 RepID=UPI00360E55AF
MTLIASDLLGQDGLAQMQAILNGDLHAPIGRTLDFDLITVERGRVEFEGRISRAVFNPLGTVHGGYAATILDTACGGAAHSCLEAGQGFTTLELKVAYHRALTEASGPVRCEGKLVSLGRRVAYTEGRLIDRQGRLCATATSTLLIFPLEPAAS